MRYLYSDTTRHGQRRVYVRAPGQPKIRIIAPEGTPEFREQYAAALRGIRLADADKPTARQRRRVLTTFGGLVSEYCASVEFAQLHPTTQAARRSCLELCALEETRPGSGDIMDGCPIEALGPTHVRMLRDRKKHLPNVANTRLKALRRLFAWAIDAGRLPAPNPAREVQRLRAPTEGYHAWTLAEIEAFESAHPVGTQARLALGLFLFTAQRISDVVRMGPQHVQDRWLVITQVKNAGRKPVLVEIPILPALQQLLDATPTTARGLATFIVNDHGRPFGSSQSFGNKFRIWCNAAGLPQCSAHGLRKAAAARLIDIGCTREEVMAITGHTTNVEIERYIRSRDRRVLAQRAVGRLSGTAE